MEPHNFHQQMKKKENQNKILELIKSEGKTNKQLLDELSYSPTTLAKHLDELTKKREIEKDIQNGEIVYVLGDQKTIRPGDISQLSTELEAIKKRGGIGRYDYSQLWIEMMAASLPWGIFSRLVIDEDLDKLEIFTREDMREIEKLIFQKIIHNMKNKKIKKQIDNGELVVGFSINYENLLKSIDSDSLNYFENMSDEEWNLMREIEDESESITEDDIKKLQKLREKTYEKIKEKNN